MREATGFEKATSVLLLSDLNSVCAAKHDQGAGFPGRL